MLESESKKDSKREPVVEWRIPRKIFEKEREGNGDGREEKEPEEPEDVLLDNWTFY